MYDLVFNIANCYYNIPHIIYYSHIGSAVAALMVGFFVFANDTKDIKSRLLFALTVTFAIWTALDLVTWIDVDSGRIMFSWSTLIVADMMLYLISFYLLFTFLFQRDLSSLAKFLLFVPVLPIIFFAPTTLNVQHFDAVTCNAIDGFLAETYLYTVELIIYLGMIAMTLWYLVKRPANSVSIKEGSLFCMALLLFLGVFLATNTLASYFDTNAFYWSLTQYALFGMVIFMGVLSYLVVAYESFNAKLIGAQALVVAVVTIIASQLLFVENETNIILILITLVFSIVGGFLLVRSVKREIQQRQTLEVLTTKLERANVRLKALDKQKSEFVSIASHQLRSPITAIRGYASLLLEESYGKLPAKAKEPLERIEHSSKLMATSIEDYLNVSRIESGNMKYNLSDFNLRDETEHLCDDLRSDAMKRGLVLLFKTNLHSRGIVHADLGKSVQIVQNLINNSIKYTEKGSVTVLVRDDTKRKKIFVDIIDTGIGMNDQTISTIFQKFERADNANSVNVHGTGLGLYVAKMMAEAMGGDISAHSEGDGKGSRFTLEMPLAM